MNILKTPRQLQNDFYDHTLEYLNEHFQYTDDDETDFINRVKAHNSLVSLLQNVFEDGMDRAEDSIVLDLRAKARESFWSYPKSIFIGLANRYSKGEQYKQ